jgi:hypothetical protein
MLIIGQPDKMFRDLRNSKGSTQLSAMSMSTVVSGDNHNVLNTVFPLSAWQRYEILFPQLILVAEANIT